MAQQGFRRDLRDRRRQDVGVEPTGTYLRRVSRVSPETLPQLTNSIRKTNYSTFLHFEKLNTAPNKD
jgi:hypothetical protein